MKKLFAILADFDDTLFFDRESLVYAARDLYQTVLKDGNVNKDNNLINNLKITIEEGKLPKGFDKKWKNNLYTLAHTKYSDKLSPNEFLINYVSEMVKGGAELIILSARGEEVRKETEGLLNAYNINYSQIILAENHDLGDEEWKLLKIKKLREKYDHLVLFEDKEENIRYILNNLKVDNLECYLVNHSIITKI